jgi:DNA-binding response OmpR family regulator
MKRKYSGTDESEFEGRRMLLIEDEYLIADDLSRVLTQHGATVIGPIPSIDAGIRAARTENVDIAIIDINLRGEMSYPIADQLSALNIPVVFATGYDEEVLRPDLTHLPRIQKPYKLDDVLALVRGLLHDVPKSKGRMQ